MVNTRSCSQHWLPQRVNRWNVS